MNGAAAGKSMGDFGVLHPKVAQAYGLGERTVLVAEFDVEALQAATPPRFSYTPVPRFPAALRDIGVVVPESIPAEQLESEIRKAGGDLLSGVRLFDLYRGNQIPAGTKSLPEGVKSLPAGTREGLNDGKQTAWEGPSPPIGRHRYFFKLYALDTTLGDLKAPVKAALEKAMAGHVLEKAELMGTYEKKTSGARH